MSGNPRWIYDGKRTEGKWVVNLHKSLTHGRRAGLSPEITSQPPTPKKAPSSAALGGGTQRALSEEGVGVRGCPFADNFPPEGSPKAALDVASTAIDGMEMMPV